MPKSAETETELYGKALEFVTEYALISIWSNSGNKLNRIIGMFWKKFENIEFILADKYKKHLRQGKTP
jgi:hypothetical protein